MSAPPIPPGAPFQFQAAAGFYDRLVREGEPYSLVGNNATAAVSVATGSVNTSITGVVTPTSAVPLVGKVMYIDDFAISLNNIGLAQLQVINDTNTRFAAYIWQGILNANAPIIIPARYLWRGFQTSNGAITLAVRNNLTGGSVNYIGAIAANGYKLTDDFNWNAAKTMLCVGDSTWNGTGPTTTANMLPFKIRDYYRAQGIDARVVLKSVSGSTTTEHELWRKAGYYDIGQIDQLWYNVSLNDAATSIASATVVANITACWTWFHGAYPTKTMIVLGPGPLENNTSEGFAAQYRTDLAAWVASVNSPYLKFIDLGSSFDRTVSSNYVGTDTPGSRVHPNDTGHAAEYTTVATAIAAQGIRL